MNYYDCKYVLFSDFNLYSCGCLKWGVGSNIEFLGPITYLLWIPCTITETRGLVESKSALQNTGWHQLLKVPLTESVSSHVAEPWNLYICNRAQAGKLISVFDLNASRKKHK